MPKHSGKKTLVLDLDETLVHSSFTEVENADLRLTVEIEGQVCEVFVLKRPGLDEFMDRMAEKYEIIIYTASLQKYADPVIDFIDPKRHTAYRLFREHCTFFKGIFVKDLSRLDRDLEDIMIIDNSPTSYLFHTECSLPIESWYEDPADTALIQYVPILESMAVVPDVRDYIKLFVFEDEIHFAKASQVLRGGKTVERVKSETRLPAVASAMDEEVLLNTDFMKKWKDSNMPINF